MRKIYTILICAIVLISCDFTKSGDQKTTEKRLQDIENRLALKALVDEFSNLADTKDIKNQVLLFNENAVVETVMNGQVVGSMTGRKQIGEVFGSFLAGFETVYHLNGQQTLNIDGNNATGISYCQVMLVGTENGKKMKTSMYVFYNDEYVLENGKWLIAKRRSNFSLQDKKEL